MSATYVYVSRHGGKADPDRCRAGVFQERVGSSQCTRKPVIEREIDGKKFKFCKQHDPVTVEAADKKRQAKWKAEADIRTANYRRAEQYQNALKACKAAIESIATGYNDARQLAEDTLKLFPTELPTPKETATCTTDD